MTKKHKKLIRIGLYLNNDGHKDVKLNSLHLGNPGIGGTDYWTYALAYFLTEYYKDVECFLFTTSKSNLLKRRTHNIIVDGVLEAFEKAKDEKMDVFIINKHANVDECSLEDLCNQINKLKISTITVGHNFYSMKECELIAKCKYIKRNVYNSIQQFSIYSDLDIHKKDSYIWPIVPMENISKRKEHLDKIVTYTGSLVSSKGFHILARNWKKILKQCPNAKLYVVGTGKLYGRSLPLGKYEVADANYEKIFMPHVLDRNGKILPSVKFLGLLNSSERRTLYRKTSVGVVNPSGISECTSASSIEFSLSGIPVVTRRYGGLIDSVINKKTGFLIKNDRQLVNGIITLLKDGKLNKFYGDNGISFVRSRFDTEKVIEQWHNVIKDVSENKHLKPVESLLLRKIKKAAYSIQTGRPPLIRKESLKTPFNNYERYNKPSLEESLIKTLYDLVFFKLKLGRIYNQLLILRYGKFKEVDASSVASSEKLIFPEEKFIMPELKDVFGRSHKYFKAYEETIPPLYVRTFKDAYCITNREEVISSEGNVISEYTSQKVNKLIGENKGIFEKSNLRKIDGKVVHLGMAGVEDNYYHFLTECIGRLYLIEKSKVRPDYYIVSNHVHFQQELLDLLSIDRKKIIPTNSNIIIKARELIVASFINNWEYIKFRRHTYYQKRWIPGWINELYKERIIPKVKKTDKKNIYISRSRSKGRKVENETEVSKIFKSFGFGIYNTETMTVKEQVELFANASVIAGIHGAGLANINFAPSTAKIFEIFPEYYHDAGYRIQANALGLRYFYMIGKTRKTIDVEPQQEEVYVDVKKLITALNIILGRKKMLYSGHKYNETHSSA